MAYGNYGAIVKKNGVRMREHEDQTPYRENEFKSGYHQAFGRSQTNLNPRHAVLGCKRVRLCAAKTYPLIYVDGNELRWHEIMDLCKNKEPFKKWDDNKECNGSVYYWEDDKEDNEISGEVEGCKFKIWMSDEPVEFSLHLELIEEDGNKWEGICAYGYGAGYE